jgi:DNA polymerase
MALAYLHGFTGGLAEVGEQLGLPADRQKLKTGKTLIRLFCHPQRITKANRHEWRDWNTDPERWDEFCDYNRQDVVAEEVIRDKLLPYSIPDDEWNFYCLDQLINDRGIPVDLDFVRNVREMSQRRRNELLDLSTRITGLANANSVLQLLGWLQHHGYPYADIRRETVQKALGRVQELWGTDDHPAVQVLRYRLWAARTSSKKADAALLSVGQDGHIRHMYQFAGASRTGRFAGRGVQPQNLARTPKLFEHPPLLDCATNLIRRGDYDGIELLVDEPMMVFSGLMRGMFRTEDEFHVCDYASVESAGLAWLTDCKRLLDVFHNGRDPYRDFGTLFYKISYDEITPAQRNICKPPCLGCLGEDTLVMTDSGWKQITKIAYSDRVWDGVEYVNHQGVVEQGVKPVIDLFGVQITPDHFVLCGEEWHKSAEVMQNIQLGRRAIRSAAGPSLRRFVKSAENYTIVVDASIAEIIKTSMPSIWNMVNRKAALPVPTLKSEKRRMESISGLGSRVKPLIGLPIDITLFCPVVGGWALPAFVTEGGVFSASLPTFMNLSGTALRFLALKNRGWRSTVSTLMGTTNRVICGLLLRKYKRAIKRLLGGLPIAVNECVPLNFGNATRRDTGIRVPLPGKYEKGYPRSKLLQTKETVAVPTFDIAECGPRHRFMVWTGAGPIIVHNCGYGLGPGKIENGEKTGLLKYAESMGVDLDEETAKRAIRVYRDGYPEIPQFWWDCQDAAFHVVKTKKSYIVGKVRFEWHKPYMAIRLPSGRRIYYYEPRIERRVVETGRKSREYVNGHCIGEVAETQTRTVFTCWGRNQKTTKWERIVVRASHFCENICQALCRDILKVGMQRVHQAGFKIVGHAHDEIITIAPKNDNYYNWQRMRDLMCQPIEWAPGFPLNASGYSAAYYRKA